MRDCQHILQCLLGYPLVPFRPDPFFGEDCMSNQRGRRSSEVSIGQYLINRLQDYGLRDVFGIPGDYVLSFYSMLEKSPDQRGGLHSRGLRRLCGGRLRSHQWHGLRVRDLLRGWFERLQ